MQTKLTRRIEAVLIERAKQHGRRRGKSVSQMVAHYFAILDAEENQHENIDPVTSSLREILREVSPEKDDQHSDAYTPQLAARDKRAGLSNIACGTSRKRVKGGMR